MKIVSIFADRLFAFHYEDEVDNEFDRLMDVSTDVSYLHAFAKRNHVIDVYGFIEKILRQVEEIEDLLEEIQQSNDPLDRYFQPLQSSEYFKRLLTLQKGKIRNNQLRIYAIRVDLNYFVITGGAIKMSQKMIEHKDTELELNKLKIARNYLSQYGVFDGDSFFELLNENR